MATANVSADWFTQQGTSYDIADLRIRATTTGNVNASTHASACLQFDFSAIDTGIPQGATITSATITLDAANVNNWNNLHAEIYCEDVDTASASGTHVNNMSKTSATTVSWEALSMVTGDPYTSPDFSAHVQQVVDRTGWDEGNVNVIIWGLTQSTSAIQNEPGSLSSETGSYSAPLLTITYNAGPQTRDITGTASGLSSASGLPLLGDQVVLHWDGSGVASPPVDFTGSQGFNSTDSPLVTSGTVSTSGGQTTMLARWNEETVDDYSGQEREFYVSSTGIINGEAKATFDLSSASLGLGARIRFWQQHGTVGSTVSRLFRAYNANDDVLLELYNPAATQQISWTVNGVGQGSTGVSGGLERYELWQTGVSSTDTWELRIYDANTNSLLHTDSATNGVLANGHVVDYIEIGNVSSSLHPPRFFQNLRIENNGIKNTEIGNYVAQTFITPSTASGLSSVQENGPTPVVNIGPEISASGVATFTSSLQVGGTVDIPPAGTTKSLGSGSASGSLNVGHSMANHGTVRGTASVGSFPIAGAILTDISYDYDVTFDDPRRDTIDVDPIGNALNRLPNRRTMDFYLPSSGTYGNGPYPTLMWLHGGRWEINGGDKTDITDVTGSFGQPGNMLQAALDAGFAVVAINYRLKDTFGPNANFIDIGDMMDDVKLAMSKLKNSFPQYFDMRKFFLSGYSAGGHIALIAGMSLSMTSPSTAAYYDQPTSTLTTKSMVTSSRYTGGYTVHEDIVVRGIAVWEAPTDLRWGALREPGGFYVADDEIRQALAAPSHASDGGFIPAEEAKPFSPAYREGVDPSYTYDSQWINSSSPRLFYVACRDSTWNSVLDVNTIVPTVNDGTTSSAGHGFILRQVAEANGVTYEEHFPSGPNHETVNAYASTEFSNWLTATLEEGLFSEALGSATASGAPVAIPNKYVAGTSSGVSAVSGTLEAAQTRDVAGSAFGVGTASGTLDAAQTREVTGTASGTSSVSSAPTATTNFFTRYIQTTYGTVYGPPYGHVPALGASTASGIPDASPVSYVSGTASGAGIATGAPERTQERLVAGTASGAAIATGTPERTQEGLVSGTASGVGIATGTPERTQERLISGTAGGISNATGAPERTQERLVSGIASGIANATGAPERTQIREITGTARGVGSVVPNSPERGGEVLIQGTTASGFGSATGTPDAAQTREVTGTASGAGSVTGSPERTQTRDITGTASGVSTIAGTPERTQARDVTGSANGLGSVTGAPERTQIRLISGAAARGVGSVVPNSPQRGGEVLIQGTSASGSGSVSGIPERTQTQEVTGIAAGTGSASGAPQRSASGLVTGTASGVGTTTGAPERTQTREVTGSASGAGSAAGIPATTPTVFLTSVPLAGLGSASGSPAKQGNQLVSGSSVGSGRASGSPTPIAVRILSGAASGIGSASGSLLSGQDRFIAGSPLGVGSASGSPTKERIRLISGSSLGVGSPSGTLTVTSDLNVTGTSQGSGSASGALLVTRSLGTTPARGVGYVSGSLYFLRISYWIVGSGDTLQPARIVGYVYDDAGTPTLGDASDLRYAFTVGVDGP